MAAPAEIPHADEALKTLVQRFKAAPGSSAFTELASALLARGHAAEALRITEHGLQLMPGSVEGRVQRSAALLAQGRPRMAYVELRRALAIEPNHRRAQRLLGKAYVDAGAPERAAALLAKRSNASGESAPAAAPTSSLAAALISDLTDDAPPSASWTTRDRADTTALPDLFSALTEDLGLGAAVPESTPLRRVEVTQIIRRKARPRPPRSASELAEIDGPIVDTSQPLPAIDTQDEPVPTVTGREAAPLFPTNPDLASLTLGDEPLFQEHMPFAVRPVGGSADDGLEPAPVRGVPMDAQPANPMPPPATPPRGSANGLQSAYRDFDGMGSARPLLALERPEAEPRLARSERTPNPDRDRKPWPLPHRVETVRHRSRRAGRGWMMFALIAAAVVAVGGAVVFGDVLPQTLLEWWPGE